MTIFGIGLHVLVALFFAVHVIRSGQQMYWLMILFAFPLLGSVVYFIAIYLPDSRLEHGARKMVTAAARTLDPGRELREARDAYAYTPTAQNQMRLATALLEAGNADEAAAVAHLQTIRASDANFRGEQVSLLLAQALAAAGRQDEAKAEFEFALGRYNSFAVQAEFAIWAAGSGDAARAGQLHAELQRTMERWTRHTRDMNQELIRRLNAAMSAVKR